MTNPLWEAASVWRYRPSLQATPAAGTQMTTSFASQRTVTAIMGLVLTTSLCAHPHIQTPPDGASAARAQTVCTPMCQWGRLTIGASTPFLARPHRALEVAMAIPHTTRCTMWSRALDQRGRTRLPPHQHHRRLRRHRSLQRAHHHHLRLHIHRSRPGRRLFPRRLQHLHSLRRALQLCATTPEPHSCTCSMRMLAWIRGTIRT